MDFAAVFLVPAADEPEADLEVCVDFTAEAFTGDSLAPVAFTAVFFVPVEVFAADVDFAVFSFAAVALTVVFPVPADAEVFFDSEDFAVFVVFAALAAVVFDDVFFTVFFSSSLFKF